MAQQPSIYLTQSDLDRLLDLLEAYAAGAGGRRFEKLENELLRAVVMPRDQIPKDVVTMNSRVLFENETTGERREITLGVSGERRYRRRKNFDTGPGWNGVARIARGTVDRMGPAER